MTDACFAAITAVRASRRKNDIIRSGLSPRRLCQRCDLTCTHILEDCTRECGRGNVCDDQRERIDVTSLCAKVIPVFCAHSQGAWFAEAWHALQGEGDEFSDLEDEDV